MGGVWRRKMATIEEAPSVINMITFSSSVWLRSQPSLLSQPRCNTTLLPHSIAHQASASLYVLDCSRSQLYCCKQFAEERGYASDLDLLKSLQAALPLYISVTHSFSTLSRICGYSVSSKIIVEWAVSPLHILKRTNWVIARVQPWGRGGPPGVLQRELQGVWGHWNVGIVAVAVKTECLVGDVRRVSYGDEKLK